MGDRARGKRPKPSRKKLPEPETPPTNYDAATPKFCLHHLCRDFDVHALNAQQQAAFAKTLQKLACLDWATLSTLPRHKSGSEFIPAASIRAPIPLAFQDQARFLVFRYNGMHPMGGVRVEDVYHVLWIEPTFGDLYDHGS